MFIKKVEALLFGFTLDFWSECYKLRFFTLNFVEYLTNIIKFVAPSSAL